MAWDAEGEHHMSQRSIRDVSQKVSANRQARAMYIATPKGVLVVPLQVKAHPHSRCAMCVDKSSVAVVAVAWGKARRSRHQLVGQTFPTNIQLLIGSDGNA